MLFSQKRNISHTKETQNKSTTLLLLVTATYYNMDSWYEAD